MDRVAQQPRRSAVSRRSPTGCTWPCTRPMYAALMLLIRSHRGHVARRAVARRRRRGAGAGRDRRRAHPPDGAGESSQGRVIEDAVNLAYPLGDVTLLVFVAVAFALSSWRPDRMWLLLGAALVVDAVADLDLRLPGGQGHVCGRGHPATRCGPPSMAMFAVAAWQPMKRRRPRTAASRRPDDRRCRWPSRPSRSALLVDAALRATSRRPPSCWPRPRSLVGASRARCSPTWRTCACCATAPTTPSPTG